MTAKQLTDDVRAIRYINSLPESMAPVLYQDFVKGTLSGIELNPESEYTIFTVGYDCYGVEAGVARAEFSTPAPVIEGNPHVEVEMTANTIDSFTVSFKPNDDVQGYWILAGEKGTMQQQYEMFGPMFGFSNFSEMIKMWGIPCGGDFEYTWTQMAPNTDYEVFVAMTDVNGWFAPYEVTEVKTQALGGSGAATVAIEVGAYALTDWYGEQAPTLTITFTPNDQASCYRMSVIGASEYDADPEACVKELCSDPWMPTSNWFQYTTVSYDYRIEPATAVVIIAAAKNGDGEWGEVSVVRYTTPDKLEGYEPAQPNPTSKKIAPRVNMKNNASAGRGVLPKLSTTVGRMQIR